MKAEKFCPVCKNLNPIGALRCIVCLAPFEAAPPITTTPVASAQPELSIKPSAHLQQLAQLPADSLVLFIMDYEQPLIIRNTDQVTLGRSEVEASDTICDLTPFGAADLGVSRMHALITIKPEGCTITDLRSTNGTWLNERRLTSHKPYALQAGDRVRLGNLRLYPYLRATGQPEAAPEVILQLVESPRSSAMFHPKITAHYLQSVLGPYLQALSDCQGVIDDGNGLTPREVVVNTISALRQDLPIGVSISGAPDAVRLLKNTILPWRAEHAGQLNDLYSVRYLPAEMEGGVAVSLNTQTTEQLDPNITSLMRMPVGTESLGRAVPPDLQAAIMVLAGQLLADAVPLLDAHDRLGFVEKLLPPLTILATAPLQLSFDLEAGNPEVDR